MIQKIREIREKNYIMPWRMFKNVVRTIPALLKGVILHPVIVVKANRVAKKLRKEAMQTYIPYTIPEYREGMQYYTENRRYLRPTHFCNSHAPEIIAMANELGAFELSDREYAEAAFDFVKNNIKLAFVPLDGAVETLQRGSGTCLHQLSLFAALCRAAGVSARYRLYSLALVESMYDNLVGASRVLQHWYDAFGSFMLHGTAEALIDGEWVTADPTFTPAYEMAMGVPLAKFGDDPTGMWNYPVEGTMMVLEGLPYGAAAGWNFLVKRALPGEVMKINMSVEKARQRGREMLEEMDLESYDCTTRTGYRAQMPKITLERSPHLVFES